MIFDAIRESHDLQRDLCRKVTASRQVLGFMFREKWKQILQRSLTEGIEQQRHKLQQELEAYKVSLIAQAEVLARTDASERAADVAKAAEWCPTGTC